MTDNIKCKICNRIYNYCICKKSKSFKTNNMISQTDLNSFTLENAKDYIDTTLENIKKYIKSNFNDDKLVFESLNHYHSIKGFTIHTFVDYLIQKYVINNLTLFESVDSDN